MRLLDAEELPRLRLGQPARLDDLVDLQREPGLQKLLLGIGQTEVGEDIAGAFFDADFSLAHVSSAFPCNVAPPRRGACGSTRFQVSASRCRTLIFSGIRAGHTPHSRN